MAGLTLNDLLNYDEPSIDFEPIRDSLLAAAGRNRDRAQSFYSDYDTTFKPLLKQFAGQAAEAGSDAALEDAARTAVGTVAGQQDVQRDATSRRLTSMGVNPNSGRFAAMESSLGLADAGARATAANTARRAKKAEGLGLLSSAAGLGMGLVNAGNSAENQATNIDQNLSSTALGVYQSGLASRMLAASALGRQQAGGLNSVPGTGTYSSTVFKDNINAPFGTYSPNGGSFGLDSLYPTNRWAVTAANNS